MGRNIWAVKTVLVSRDDNGALIAYGTRDGDIFLLDSSDLDELKNFCITTSTG